MTRSVPAEDLTRTRTPVGVPGMDRGAPAFRPGYLVRERYQLIEAIGTGAMGQVWEEVAAQAHYYKSYKPLARAIESAQSP